MVTEAQKRATNKWSAANMSVLGVKVRKDYADEVRKKAKERGDTVNGILKAALGKYMEE